MASIGSEHAPRSYWRMPTRLSWRADLSDTISRLRALFADGSDFLPGAPPRRRRLPYPRRQRAARLHLADPAGALDGRLRVRHLRLRLDLGAADRRHGRPRPRHRRAALHSRIPEHRQLALLRGYLRGSRLLAIAIACAIALAGAGAVTLLKPYLDHDTTVPLYLACVGAADLSRSRTCRTASRAPTTGSTSALVPTYVLRQIAAHRADGAAYALRPADRRRDRDDPRRRRDLVGVTIGQLRACSTAGWRGRWRPGRRPTRCGSGCVSAADPRGRGLLPAAHLHRRPGAAAVPAAGRGRGLLRRRQDAGAGRLHLLLDRGHDRAPLQRYHVAGDRDGLAPFSQASIQWTFWPSLVATALLLALGKPILRAVRREFADGYHLMFILAIGLLARAAIGPIERLLNMLGERRSCALVYAGAFAINLVLCVALIPWRPPAPRSPPPWR